MEIATVLFAQKRFSKEFLNFEICYRCDLLVVQGVIVLVISNRCRSSLLAIDRPILKCPARLLPEFYSSCILSIILKNIATVNISFWLVCRGRFNLCQIVSIAEQVNFNRYRSHLRNVVCPRWYLRDVVPGVVVYHISCMGWVGEWDQIWTDSGSHRRLNKLTSDLTQVEL